MPDFCAKIYTEAVGWACKHMNILGYSYHLHDVVGNIGVVLLIASYWALQIGKLDAQGLAYSCINLCVAILLGVNLYFRPNISSIIIEIFWAAISVYGIIRAQRASR